MYIRHKNILEIWTVVNVVGWQQKATLWKADENNKEAIFEPGFLSLVCVGFPVFFLSRKFESRQLLVNAASQKKRAFSSSSLFPPFDKLTIYSKQIDFCQQKCFSHLIYIYMLSYTYGMLKTQSVRCLFCFEPSKWSVWVLRLHLKFKKDFHCTGTGVRVLLVAQSH